MTQRTRVLLFALYTALVVAGLGLGAAMGRAYAQEPAPTLTREQQTALRMSELEAENALLRLQLAQAQFERARDGFQQQLTALTTPTHRPEKVEGIWRLVPLTP